MRRHSEVNVEQQIERPSCPKCGWRMMLQFIQPDDQPDRDRRTFRCFSCDHVEIIVVRLR